MVLKEEAQNYLMLSGEIFNMRRILVKEEDDLSFYQVDFAISVVFSDVVQ